MSAAVSDHPVTEYGTTRCPVERVAAEIDGEDGTCSACGAQVITAEAPGCAKSESQPESTPS